MNNIIYIGPFKDHIRDFINLKQAIGYKYSTEAKHMKRFDFFTTRYKDANTLTKEIVMEWCSKKPHETQANLNSRSSIIRQFSLYLDNIGLPAYILPKGYFKKGQKYVPYIYTNQELKRFFKQTDQCHYTPECPYRHLIMPIIFRMIYSCGLRVSEARLLKVEDVDLELGILTIEHSKKDISRLVPMSDELINRCNEYYQKAHYSSNKYNYFFPSINGNPLTIANIYKNFRRFLWRAGISHGGRGHGPRIHDFRHTFAVHCLRRWSKQGKDLLVYLPILRVYLGHDSFEETAYYLRLTADVFPDITLKLETKYFDLIPTLCGGRYESN